MFTDKHLYEVFEAFPQWLFELIQRPSPGPCRFQSIAIKAIERRADGVLIPDAIEEAIWVVELQLQLDRSIYGRIVVEMALVQDEHNGRAVQGIIIFGSKKLNPKTEPWCQIVSAYYLDELINQLAEQSPDHPLVVLFQPLIEKNTEFLEQNVAKYYNRIKMFPTDSRSKSKLLDVFVDWLLQRFKNRGKMEIEKMLLGELPDLQETQAGKDLIAIGREKCIEKMLLGELPDLQETQAGKDLIAIGREKCIEKMLLGELPELQETQAGKDLIAIGIEKGELKGIEKGELLGTIRICQSILGTTVYRDEELLGKSIEELRRIATELQTNLRDRFGTERQPN